MIAFRFLVTNTNKEKKMKEYIWDEERGYYYRRGLGFWGEIAVLVFIGIGSVVLLSVFIWHDGWGWLIVLPFWIPVYVQFWNWFGTDYRWPKKSLEQIKREDEEWREKILKQQEQSASLVIKAKLAPGRAEDRRKR